MKLRMLIIPLILMLLVTAGAGRVETLVPLPADLNGELNGVPYRIRVPANWNGTLLVYAYGYAEAFDPPPQAPMAPDDADAQALLAKGFALAGLRAAGAAILPGVPTAAGWNFKERMQSTAALTAAFRGMVGRPKHTIMWGKSMGGLVTLAMIEKFPGLFDGGVALCPVAAGTPRVFDQKLNVVLAYAVAFGWKSEWGTPGYLRPDLDFMNEVVPVVASQLTPANLWRWEFLRLVNRIPLDYSFYYGKPLPFLFQALWLAFVPQPDLNQRANGRVAQNLGRVYTLKEEDRSYLQNNFGVASETLNSMLAAMSAQAIYASDRNARNYAEHYFNPTGKITRPVLTLHTTRDAAAIPNNESAYRTVVEKQGRGNLLMQQFTTGIKIGDVKVNTHCTFSPQQYFAGIDAMMYWLETGTRPDPSVFFPKALGFDPKYVPEPWPW